MEKIIHTWWPVSILLVGVVVGALFVINTDHENYLAAVHILDIGQGDAILVELPDEQRWLIDGGPDDSVIAKLQQVLPFGERQLTGLILTHPHNDHVAGLNSVLELFSVKYVVMAPSVHTSPSYINFLETLKNKKIEVITIDEPVVWQNESDQWTWEFVYPQVGVMMDTNLNNQSIVSRLVVGEQQFLFTGDAEVEVEQLLVGQGIDLSATVLKVGHHGSDTSTSQLLLDAVNPDYAVISLGANNSFGHPHVSVIDRLKSAGAQIFRTDEHGTISLYTDGVNLNIDAERAVVAY